MRKIFTIIAVAATYINGYAQALPNPGFESWTHHTAGAAAGAYDEPVGWHTLDSTIANTSFGVVTSFKATAAGEFHSGTAAIKLQTQNVVIQIANAIATTGTINTTTQAITGGIPYTGRPDSIVGYYRATPVGVDSGFIQLTLFGAGGGTDTVGYVRFKTTRATVSTFTRFAAAVNYHNANAVVTSQWLLSSSADATTHNVNSTLWVDDLQLVTNPVGIAEQSKAEVIVYPNPASNSLQINNVPSKSIVSIFDVTGRKVLTQQLVNTASTIDVTSLHSGLYLYSIVDENRKAIKTGKVVIQK